MRVLLVNHVMDRVTGAGTAERTASLSRALVAAGGHPSILTLDIGLDARLRHRLGDTPIVALRCLERRFYLPEPTLGRIHSAVAAADVVHLSSHWTILNALAYRAARRTGTPLVVTPAGALGVFGRSTTLKRGYNAAVGGAIVRTAAAHIAVTEAERRDFAAYGVRPDSVAVIPNGVWSEEFTDPGADARSALRTRLGNDTRPFVLYMGRLNHNKGPDLLMAAAALARERLGEVRLVFAGPDEGMGQALRTQASAAGLSDHVVFLGHVDAEVKVAAYREAQLLVVPSRHEAMSLVALEAGASGTPVLLTDSCGFPEVEQVGGGLVVPTTAEGLADGLVNLLSEPAHLPMMGRRLQELVSSACSWDRAARAHLNLYRPLGGMTK